LASTSPRHPLGRIALGRARQALRAEASAVDHGIEAEPLRLAARERGVPAAARRGLEALDQALESHHAAAIFEIAAQREHKVVAIDDTGFRRMHRRDAGERRLEALGHRGIDDLDAFHAVDLRLLVDRLEPSDFVGIGGDDELAAFAVRHAVRGAKIVKHAPSARTVIRAPRAGRIIKPRVDDLAVAGRDASADAGGRLRHHHVMSGDGSHPRDRQPDHARSDHQHLHPPGPAHISTGSPA
jgi:hypothetical protein